MELQQLQHFIALARIGNIGRAADELHITHSGLSRSIKSLEDFLGLTLFERRSRGVAITPFGTALLPRATHILNERSRAIGELEALRSLRGGQVEIALHPVFDDTIAAAVLDRFALAFPEVEVDVWSGADPDLGARVMAGDADFGFTLFAAARDEQALLHEPLFTLPVRAYASPDYPLQGTELGLDALMAAEWLLLGASAFRRAFDGYFRAIGSLPPPRIRQVGSLALFRTMMASGPRLTLLPRAIAERDPAAFREVTTTIATGGIEGGLVFRRDRFHAPPALALLDFFREGGRTLGA